MSIENLPSTDDAENVDTSVATEQPDDDEGGWAKPLPEEQAALEAAGQEEDDEQLEGSQSAENQPAQADTATAKPAETQVTDPADDAQIEAQLENLADLRDQLTDAGTKREELLKQMDDAAKQYDDGEIGEGGFQATMRRLDLELQRIIQQENRLQDSLYQTQSKVESVYGTEAENEQKWMDAQASFFAKPENAVFVEGSGEYAALNDAVQRLAQTLPNTATFDDLLGKARAMVGIMYDLPAGTATPAPATAAAKPSAPAAPVAKPPRHDLPPNLGTVAPVVANESGNEFDYLDKLTGIEYEEAVGRLTEAQKERFLTSPH